MLLNSKNMPIMEVAIINNGQISMSENHFNGILLETASLAAKIATNEALKIYQEKQDQKKLLTTKEAAQQLNCTSKTIIKYILKGKKNNKLKAIQDGKQYKISQFDLNVFKTLLYEK